MSNKQLTFKYRKVVYVGERGNNVHVDIRVDLIIKITKLIVLNVELFMDLILTYIWLDMISSMILFKLILRANQFIDTNWGQFTLVS